LYVGEDSQARGFRHNIRAYNGSLAFTSVNHRRLPNPPVGGYVPFQIMGELYHLQGPLQNDEGVPPVFAQVWIYDSEYANDLRCSRSQNVSRATINELTDMLERCNPFPALYKMAHEQLSRDEPVSMSITPQLRLVMDIGGDRRTENLPTASEVAAVIPGGADTTSRDLALVLRTPTDGRTCKKIDVTHPAYLPLHYVLLFPHGDGG